MQGTVIGVNGDRCAVTAGKSITLFRIEGAHATEVGDIISENLDALGQERLFNETRQQRLKTFIARWGCSRAMADTYLGQ